jgi:uncharacterized lipoprotein YddW (UPF0748 family)
MRYPRLTPLFPNISSFFIFHFSFFTILLLLSTASPDEVRAIWGTRWDYKSPEDVRSMVKNVAEHGFNVFLFQVRGNGTVFYPSSIEPWAWELTGNDPSTLGQNPGWDPLQTAIDESQKYGIELHAYMNVYPAWRGTRPPPPEVNQIYNTHPEWFSVDSSGTTDSLNSGYIPLSPGIPDVRDYLFDVYMEVVENYPGLDGIHLDYVRYFGSNFSYDNISLNEFKKETGETPESDPEAWNQWRRDQVSKLVRRIYHGAHRINPSINVSAATWPKYSSGRNTYFQDAHAWMSEAILDTSFKMTYYRRIKDLEIHSNECVENRALRHAVPAVGVSRFPDDSELTINQLNAIRNTGSDGVVFFDYSSIFPKHIPNVTAEAVLAEAFLFPDECPEKLWLRDTEDDDPTAPRIFNFRTDPDSIFPGQPFYILCDIEDESGVNDSSVLLRHAIDADPGIEGTTITLQHISGSTYKTDQAMIIQSKDYTFYYQILARDSDDDKAGDSALRISPILSLKASATVEHLIYYHWGSFGQLSGAPQYAALDNEGKIWVPEWANHRIRVYHPDGTEASFSPVMKGLDVNGNLRELSYPSGIAAANDGSIYVTLDNDYIEPKFSAVAGFQPDGTPISGRDLNFRPGDCDISDAGLFFCVHKLEDAFTLWESIPADGVSSYTFTGAFFPGSYTCRGIACDDSGESVYRISSYGGYISMWQKTGKPFPDYQLVNEYFIDGGVQSGAVDVASNGWIFVSNEEENCVKLYNSEGDLLQDLNFPALVPRGVAISPDTTWVYIVPFSSSTQKIQVWKRVDYEINTWSLH